MPRIDGERVCWPCKDKSQTVEHFEEPGVEVVEMEDLNTVKVDATVLTKVIETIETEARLTMKLMLVEGKGHFENAVKEMAAATVDSRRETEQNAVIEFFRGRRTEDEIWNECPLFKAALLEKITARWGQKTP